MSATAEIVEMPSQKQGLSVVAQRPSFSLAPQNLTEAMKFAEMMAASELVPKNFRSKPGDVLIAVEMGREVGLSPMAAIQNIGVINGKPGLYGDAGKAILLAGGCIIEEDDIEIIKATGRARCKVTRKGRPPVERTYSLDNARTAGLWGKEGPWKTNPERQMAWRAFWFAARDAAADLLKGIGGAEELVDYTPVEREPDRKSGQQVAESVRPGVTIEQSPELNEARNRLIADLELIASESGLNAYADSWQKLTAEQRKMIGADEHARLKALAAPSEDGGDE